MFLLTALVIIDINTIHWQIFPTNIFMEPTANKIMRKNQTYKVI